MGLKVLAADKAAGTFNANGAHEGKNQSSTTARRDYGWLYVSALREVRLISRKLHLRN
jgi:hypothetical protein